MFHGSCRKVSKVLSLALEPISKSAVHYLARRVYSVKVAKEPRYRRCIAVDETATCQEILRIHMVCCRRRFKEITGSRGVVWEEQPKRIDIS
jgi:hypothetical protein